MHSISYRACETPDSWGLNASNRISSERPLVLNCAGTHKSHARINTYNRIGRDDYYLLCVKSGRLRVFTDEGEWESTKGDLWIFPPGVKYRYTHTTDDELEYTYVHFTGAEVEGILDECALKLYPECNRLKDDFEVYQRFQSIFDAFAYHDELRDRELSSLLERLLITCGRAALRRDAGTGKLKRSLAFINSEYHTHITVPARAEMDNLSPSRYSALFRDTVGVPPMEYVTRLRIATACALLSTTDYTVARIGMTVGYSDPHFFSRIFKKLTGTSPQEFRKSGQAAKE